MTLSNTADPMGSLYLVENTEEKWWNRLKWVLSPSPYNLEQACS